MFRFSRSLKSIKRQWARFGLSFAVVNIIKMISVLKLRFCEGRRSPAIIWLCLWSSSICENCLADHLKTKKIGVTKAVSSLFAILCFLPLSQNWSYELFLSTGTRKGSNMFNCPANLRKFHRRKHDNSFRFSGREGLWILRGQLLETLDSIT